MQKQRKTKYSLHQEVMSSHFPRKQGLSIDGSCCGRPKPGERMPTPSPCSLLLLITSHHLVWNFPLVCLGQESWLHIPQGLAHLQVTSEGRYWRDSLDSCVSNSYNTGVLPTPFSLPTQSTAWGRLLQGKIIPSQSNKIYPSKISKVNAEPGYVLIYHCPQNFIWEGEKGVSQS